jgi:hypothetical protein
MLSLLLSTDPSRQQRYVLKETKDRFRAPSWVGRGLSNGFFRSPACKGYGLYLTHGRKRFNKEGETI